jgi:superfamily II DNA helicase RecQ
MSVTTDGARPGGAVIEDLARERLGFEQLRSGQLRAAEALSGGRDVLAVLPTGGGKSAIYELAGMLRTGPTVVVSPLIALQDDQLAHLQAAGLPAIVLNSQQSAGARAAALLASCDRVRSFSCPRSSWRTPRPGERSSGRGRGCSPWTRRT